MITYPGTNGIFTNTIKDVRIIKDRGLVWMGANMNAGRIIKLGESGQIFVILIYIKPFVFHMVEEDLVWVLFYVNNI